MEEHERIKGFREEDWTARDIRVDRMDKGKMIGNTFVFCEECHGLPAEGMCLGETGLMVEPRGGEMDRIPKDGTDISMKEWCFDDESAWCDGGGRPLGETGSFMEMDSERVDALVSDPRPTHDSGSSGSGSVGHFEEGTWCWFYAEVSPEHREMIEAAWKLLIIWHSQIEAFFESVSGCDSDIVDRFHMRIFGKPKIYLYTEDFEEDGVAGGTEHEGSDQVTLDTPWLDCLYLRYDYTEYREKVLTGGDPSTWHEVRWCVLIELASVIAHEIVHVCAERDAEACAYGLTIWFRYNVQSLSGASGYMGCEQDTLPDCVWSGDCSSSDLLWYRMCAEVL